MGNSVKTGSYYTFPDLTVTGNAGDKGYVVRFMFTRAVETGDKIAWPSLPAGWAENANSSEFVRMIDISAGATTADLQTFLRSVQISLKTGKNGHAVMVLISESSADAGRTIYYSSDTEQWYEYVPAQNIRWDDAYNEALDKSFLMQKGYLAVITQAVENQFIHSIKGPTRYGWIGGTRMDIRTVLNPVTGKLTGEPGPSLDYWYWASGPEWTGDPSESVFFNKKTVSDPVQPVTIEYSYNNWAGGEPNGATWGGEEAYTHLYGNATWNDYKVDNSSINGYIVEYPGTPVANAIGIVGYNSTKSASLNEGAIANGTSSSPIQLLGGDVITYTITAVNTSDENNTTVIVRDTVPVGLEIVSGSVSDGGSISFFNRLITWNLTLQGEQSYNVSYKAKKTVGASGSMVNTAYVTSSGTIISKTNSTYHKGEVCNVTFATGTGGTINNGNPETVDYGSTPSTGVIVTADPGYTFKGWSYPGYSDLKGTPRTAGNNIIDYTTIAIYGDITLTANFEKNTYNIVYTLNSGTVAGTNPTTYDVTTPTITLINPTRPGYTFDGWTGSNGSTPQTNVTIPTGSTGNRTYEANWTPTSYSITYLVDTDVTNPPSNPVSYNTTQTPITLSDPTRPGYTFQHWKITSDAAGVTIPNGKSITSGTYGNLTCTAVWTIETYTIDYTLNGGSVAISNPVNYKVTDLPITLNNPTRPGYTFAGWTGSNGSTAQTAVTITTTSNGVPGNLNYTANWTPITYSITYSVGAGGTNPTTNPVSYNITQTPITLVNPSRPGYIFTNWTIQSDASGVTIPTGTTITSGTYGNLTCTANWTLDTYNITYTLDGGSVAITNPTTYTIASLPITLNNPTKSGWTFAGWKGSNGTTPQTTVTITTTSNGVPGHLDYIAVWTEDDYLINYNYNGGIAPTTSNKSSYKAVDAPFSISNQPTRPGYTFTGWTGNNGTIPQTTVNVAAGTTGNLSYLANWSAINYNITYVLGSGGVNHASNPTSYNITTPTITLGNPTRPGYTFAGWTIASNLIPGWSGNTIPIGTIGNLTCTAIWNADSYPISYDYKGGNAPVTANPVSYDIEDTPFSISNQPTRPGYTFTGWTGSNGTTPQTTVNVAIGTTGALNYDANWTTISYTITYNVGTGGTNPGSNPTSYDIEDTPIPLANPTRPGYSFSHWSITSDAAGVIIPNGTTITTGTYGNLICTAVWNVATYTISYDYDGGTAPVVANPVNYDITTLPITLNPPTRPGYTFDDWTITSVDPITIPNGNNIPVGTTGNLVCKANWTIVSYNIIYNLNGGSGGSLNPTSYDVTLTPFSITDQPTKSGHTFVGWTGSNGTIPETTVNVPLNTTGDLTYDAKWSFHFADDTVFSCTPPLLLQSGHDGLSYVWILPDGSSRTTADIYAEASGEYILRTNYGSMVIADTIYVLLAFEANTAIENISTTGPKVGKPQIFTVNLNPALTNVTYQWTFNGASPATSTADTVAVVFGGAGSKRVSVNVTVTLGLLVCQKTLLLDLDIHQSNRNFFVDQHVYGGLEDGSSWENAYRRIQDALVNATEGDCIWVAKGEYTPPTNSSYQLTRDSIEIYGGFGAWEENLYERNFANNPTILRGSGTSIIVNTNAGRDARWDGFIIENGTATQGGAIFNNNSLVTIANCIIRSNTADEGSAIYSLSSDPLLYNVEISGNTAQKGGAMYNLYSNPSLINVTISGNKATTGGGLYNENSNPVIQNSIIWGNQAETFSDIANEASIPSYSYSLIAGSKASGSWNTALGTDGGKNLDGNPLFKKKGFDDNGNMQAGNYHLSTSSSAIDKGLNKYVYNVAVRWSTYLKTLSDVTYLTGFPNDLSNNERITYDRVDMGAYETSSNTIIPDILRGVFIPEVEGLITDPIAGMHYIPSHSNFVFTIKAAPGYSLDYLTITTGIEIRDKEGLIIVKNEDGSVMVTIIQVTEPITLTINGVSPTSNNSINEQKVWSYNSNLYINTDKQSNVQIFTMAGHLYMQQKVNAGETIIPLAQGFYTIKMNDKVYKIVNQ
jgi:uncharacterized repeat protein (TIGR02543 family)